MLFVRSFVQNECVTDFNKSCAKRILAGKGDKATVATDILSRAIIFFALLLHGPKNVLHLHSERPEDGHTVDVAQLVRASDCGSEGRGFEPLLPPKRSPQSEETSFFASVRACRLGSLNARCARHLPHPTPGLCTARRSKSCRQPHSPASARQQPNLPTHAAIDSRAARRFSLLPPDRRASARRQTSLPPHRRSADSKAVRRAPLHFPLRHNRPIFRNRHYPHKHLNLRNRHRPSPSASKRHKKTAVPALGTAVVSMLEPA